MVPFRVQGETRITAANWMVHSFAWKAGLSQQSLYRRHHPLESHLNRWECSAVGNGRRFTIAIGRGMDKSRKDFSVSDVLKE